MIREKKESMVEEPERELCLSERLLRLEEESEGTRCRSRAVMGPAHAASGAGLAAIVLGFLAIAGGPFVAGLTFLKVLVTIPGGALSPDLDSNVSTAKNTLGFVGSLISYLYRGSSLVVQSLVRTKKDNRSPDPHRGFWHTLLGAATIGFIFYWLTTIPLAVTDSGLTLGYLLGIFLGGLLLYIGLHGVASNKTKKVKKKIPVLGDLVLFLVSVGFIHLLQAGSADPSNFVWLGLSVGLGAVIHIFGDSITRAGVPIFFPFTAFTKGKAWWDTRFANYEAKDEKLNRSIFDFSMLLVLVGSALYMLALFGGINLGLL